MGDREIKFLIQLQKTKYAKQLVMLHWGNAQNHCTICGMSGNMIGGQKVAKKFNATERGMRYVKHNYSKQKPFWLLVNSMCNHGHTAKAAISLIYEVYGESQKVLYILKRIRKDKGKTQQFHATVNQNK